MHLHRLLTQNYLGVHIPRLFAVVFGPDTLNNHLNFWIIFDILRVDDPRVDSRNQKDVWRTARSCALESKGKLKGV